MHCAYGKADEQRPTAGNRTEARLMSSTRTPLTGNPLAVFTDGRGLTDKEMQLWREMNLSETTFVLPRR